MAFAKSQNYEVVECDINEVKNRIQYQGFSISPNTITRMINDSLNVKYVLFTQIKTIDSSENNNRSVQLSAELINTHTQKVYRSACLDMAGDVEAIPETCVALLSDLLDEQLTPQKKTKAFSKKRPKYKKRYTENAGCGLNMKMVYVEGGTFQMGATSEQNGEGNSDEKPVHSVTLESYYIAECEVTQEQWQKIMGANAYQQGDDAGNNNWIACGVGDNYPVYCVNWYEAQAFCQELSARTGKTYLLPTEAQWEYAARGGRQSKGYKYSGSYAIDAVAWYASNSDGTNHPAMSKRANELGLYDMSGSVWEWCDDWYSGESLSIRVVRGGSFKTSANECCVSNRFYAHPQYAHSHEIGFRVVCLP